MFPKIATMTRVCAYDRPNTTSVHDKPTPSTPVSQPTTAASGVADLQALLTAAREPAPYVLVGASWGGMITNLFARLHPSEVAGLVFVDAASEFLRSSLTAAQWNEYLQTVKALLPSGIEVPNYEASTDEVLTAGRLPRVPAAVVTSSHRWSLLAGKHDASTWSAWLEAQDRLAAVLHASRITNTDSGHVIAIERPQVVVGAIREVLNRSSSPFAPLSGSAAPILGTRVSACPCVDRAWCRNDVWPKPMTSSPTVSGVYGKAFTSLSRDSIQRTWLAASCQMPTRSPGSSGI